MPIINLDNSNEVVVMKLSTYLELQRKVKSLTEQVDKCEKVVVKDASFETRVACVISGAALACVLFNMFNQ